MRILWIIITGFFFFISCQNEKSQESIAEATTTNQDSTAISEVETVESAFQAIEITPEVMFVKKEELILTNKVKVPLPGMDSDTTVILLARHGEREEGRTSLSQMGRMQAARMANILGEAGIKTFYWADNAGMQTGFHAASANEAELLNYNAQDLGAFINTILKNDSGKRIAVMGDIISVPEVMNRLLKGGPFKTLGIEDHNSLYILIMKGEEVLEVLRTEMYSLGQ